MTTSSSTSKRRFPGAAGRIAALAFLALALAILAWAANGLAGWGSVAASSGSLHVAGISAPARIVRDERDIPHIIARTDHDLFFAQGYVEACDRLFQMDLLRRFVYGRLAEVLGGGALPADENARVAPIASIVEAQWSRMDRRDRMLVQAYADGVNAAMTQQPLPVEFHLLLYKPDPWRPQDSLAVGMATVLDLIDRWSDVIRRDAVATTPDAGPLHVLYGITDPAYDAPIAPTLPAPVSPLPSFTPQGRAAMTITGAPDPPALGSNEWAIGAQRSATGRALLANDPHLRLGIPGVWYLLDLKSDRLDVAGASLPGTPGVVLGHNRDLAWGATNGTVTTEVVYRDPISSAQPRRERFHVRFGHDAIVTYYRTRHGFVVQTARPWVFAVDWNAVRAPNSPLTTFRRLNEARSIDGAIAALRSYPGPPQNFVIADRSGAVAYHLAGLIPADPSWGLRVHRSADPIYPFVSFNRLPQVAASRAAFVFTANNRMYGRGYPLRLTANFEPPYRAKRIESLLSAKKRLTVADCMRAQSDTLSYPERDVAAAMLVAARRKHLEHDPVLLPYLAALRAWDGRFDPNARGAAVAWELRRIAVASLAQHAAGHAAPAYQASANNADLVLLMRVLRERPRGWWPNSDYDAMLVASLQFAVRTYGTRMLTAWGRYGSVKVAHPLATIGFSFLDGATFPGDGDSFTLHAQTATHSQSLRAVWDVGNWDAGGIAIPSGESGEPDSGHYTDLSGAWIRQQLTPLPFSATAVRAHTRATLILTPRSETP